MKRELKAASGEWINDIAREVPRSESQTNEYSTASEIIRKSIRGSWKITSKYSSHLIDFSSVFVLLLLYWQKEAQ